jgi:hypothetical protein
MLRVLAFTLIFTAAIALGVLRFYQPPLFEPPPVIQYTLFPSP